MRWKDPTCRVGLVNSSFLERRADQIYSFSSEASEGFCPNGGLSKCYSSSGRIVSIKVRIVRCSIQQSGHQPHERPFILSVKGDVLHVWMQSQEPGNPASFRQFSFCEMRYLICCWNLVINTLWREMLHTLIKHCCWMKERCFRDRITTVYPIHFIIVVRGRLCPVL